MPLTLAQKLQSNIVGFHGETILPETLGRDLGSRLGTEVECLNLSFQSTPSATRSANFRRCSLSTESFPI
jgi:hypothetical protein